MPTIELPKNPNTDTLFVVQDDGKKNRALMVAPQDTSTLELPSNPNSTKGYVTIDGEKHRVVLTADVSGGGSVDASKFLNVDVLPTADADSAGKFYLYNGETDASYTHGYIYECVATPTYTDTTTFEPATLSGTVVTATTGALSGLAGTYIHADVTSIVSGTLTYDLAGELWVFYGYDADNNEVGHFQLYQQDYVDAGFTFTGTPQDGDVVAFTTTITQTGYTYAWVRVDVQPIPNIIDDSSVGYNKTWSAHKLNATIGDIESLLAQI